MAKGNIVMQAAHRHEKYVKLAYLPWISVLGNIANITNVKI